MTGRRTIDDVLDGAMRDGALVPSSGFVDAVMSSVRVEATTPAPIAFPWARVWPAAALAVLCTAAPLAMAIGQPTPAGWVPDGEIAGIIQAFTSLAATPDVQLAALAIALTGLLIVIPGRLLSRT